MSLEEKFAKLSVDDVTSVVETVKSDGVEKSGLAANATVLAARCASEDDKEAMAALKTVKALAESGVPGTQVFTKECLGACKYAEFRYIVNYLQLTKFPPESEIARGNCNHFPFHVLDHARNVLSYTR